MGRTCEGRVALVTGASRGIGKAIAHRLAAEGASVAICSRPQPGLADLGTLDLAVSDLQATGSKIVGIPFDLSDPSNDLSQLVATVEQELGKIDILVNNAAAGGFKPFMDWSDSGIEKILQLNFWVPWKLIREVLPQMRERGEGWIINLSSATAIPPVGPPFPPTGPASMGTMYGGSKAFLDRWTASLGVEAGAEGIAVNTLAPQAAAATEVLLAHSNLPDELYEPLETMAEAALALATASATELTGRITYSLELLAELQRPTFTLDGTEELTDWAPATLPARIAIMKAHSRGEREGQEASNVPDLLKTLRD